MLAGWLPDVACRERPRVGVSVGGAADPRTQLRGWRRGSFSFCRSDFEEDPQIVVRVQHSNNRPARTFF